MKKILCSAMLFLIFVGTGYADSLVDINDAIIEPTTSPLELADTVLIYVPAHHHELDRVEKYERVIDGNITKIEKGLSPVTIVHTANTLIRRLEAGVPVRLCLKKFVDREEYYIIAILPVDNGNAIGKPFK